MDQFGDDDTPFEGFGDDTPFEGFGDGANEEIGETNVSEPHVEKDHDEVAEETLVPEEAVRKDTLVEAEDVQVKSRRDKTKLKNQEAPTSEKEPSFQSESSPYASKPSRKRGRTDPSMGGPTYDEGLFAPPLEPRRKGSNMQFLLALQRGSQKKKPDSSRRDSEASESEKAPSKGKSDSEEPPKKKKKVKISKIESPTQEPGVDSDSDNLVINEDRRRKKTKKKGRRSDSDKMEASVRMNESENERQESVENSVNVAMQMLGSEDEAELEKDLPVQQAEPEVPEVRQPEPGNVQEETASTHEVPNVTEGGVEQPRTDGADATPAEVPKMSRAKGRKSFPRRPSTGPSKPVESESQLPDTEIKSEPLEAAATPVPTSERAESTEVQNEKLEETHQTEKIAESPGVQTPRQKRLRMKSLAPSTPSNLPKQGKSMVKVDLKDPELLKPFEHGFRRELVFRSTGGGADVYYFPPVGKKLRSSTEVRDYLHQHSYPLTLANFSFQKALLSGDPKHELARGAASVGQKTVGFFSPSPSPSTPLETPMLMSTKRKRKPTRALASPIDKSTSDLAQAFTDKPADLNGSAAIGQNSVGFSSPDPSPSTPMGTPVNTTSKQRRIRAADRPRAILRSLEVKVYTPSSKLRNSTSLTPGGTFSPTVAPEPEKEPERVPPLKIKSSLWLRNPSQAIPVPTSIDVQPLDSSSTTKFSLQDMMKESGFVGNPEPERSGTPAEPEPEPRLEPPPAPVSPAKLPESIEQPASSSVTPASNESPPVVRKTISVRNASYLFPSTPREKRSVRPPNRFLDSSGGVPLRTPPPPKPVQQKGDSPHGPAPCTVLCPRARGQFPNLSCSKCLCLYHGSCLGYSLYNPEGSFVCPACMNGKRGEDIVEVGQHIVQHLSPADILGQSESNPRPTVMKLKFDGSKFAVTKKASYAAAATPKLAIKPVQMQPMCLLPTGSRVLGGLPLPIISPGIDYIPTTSLPNVTLPCIPTRPPSPPALSQVVVKNVRNVSIQTEEEAAPPPPVKSPTPPPPPPRPVTGCQTIEHIRDRQNRLRRFIVISNIPVCNERPCPFAPIAEAPGPMPEAARLPEIRTEARLDDQNEVTFVKEPPVKPAKAIAPSPWNTDFPNTLSYAYKGLLHVFSYLTPVEKGHAASVCKLWQKLANEPSLWGHVDTKKLKVRSLRNFFNRIRKLEIGSLDLRGIEKKQRDSLYQYLNIPDVKHIILCPCSGDIVELLFRTCNDLVELVAEDVNGGQIDFTDVKGHYRLEKIVIKSIEGFQASSLSDLQKLHKIKQLSLLGVTNMTGLKYLELMPRLEVLRLGSLSSLDEREMKDSTTFRNIKNLNTLRLEDGPEWDSELSLLHSFGSLEQLSSLELLRFKADSKLGYTVSLLPNLEKFLFMPITSIDSSETVFGDLLDHLPALPNLKQFCLLLLDDCMLFDGTIVVRRESIEKLKALRPPSPKRIDEEPMEVEEAGVAPFAESDSRDAQGEGVAETQEREERPRVLQADKEVNDVINDPRIWASLEQDFSAIPAKMADTEKMPLQTESELETFANNFGSGQMSPNEERTAGESHMSADKNLDVEAKGENSSENFEKESEVQQNYREDAEKPEERCQGLTEDPAGVSESIALQAEPYYESSVLPSDQESRQLQLEATKIPDVHDCVHSEEPKGVPSMFDLDDENTAPASPPGRRDKVDIAEEIGNEVPVSSLGSHDKVNPAGATVPVNEHHLEDLPGADGHTPVPDSNIGKETEEEESMDVDFAESAVGANLSESSRDDTDTRSPPKETSSPRGDVTFKLGGSESSYSVFDDNSKSDSVKAAVNNVVNSLFDIESLEEPTPANLVDVHRSEESVGASEPASEVSSFHEPQDENAHMGPPTPLQPREESCEIGQQHGEEREARVRTGYELGLAGSEHENVPENRSDLGGELPFAKHYPVVKDLMRGELPRSEDFSGRLTVGYQTDSSNREKARDDLESKDSNVPCTVTPEELYEFVKLALPNAQVCVVKVNEENVRMLTLDSVDWENNCLSFR